MSEPVPVDPSWVKTVEHEILPCGEGIKTMYHDAAGVLQRQDYHVIVSDAGWAVATKLTPPQPGA